MARLARRISQAGVVAIGVSLVAFVLVRLVPGDPARVILGAHATPQAVAALRAQLHLNRSTLTQLAQYLGGLIQGDFGTSLVQQQRSVLSIIGADLPVTLSLIGVTILLSTAVGIPLGVIAARSRHRSVDLAIRGVTMAMLATPSFFVGIILVIVVALSLGFLPAGGWGSSWSSDIRYLVLPGIALSWGYLMPLITRVVRQASADVSREEFVDAAVARGLSARRVTWRHVLPNSAIPVITLVGFNFGGLLAGAVVVETVFNLPGVGAELVQAVGSRDYPVVQGIAVMSGLGVVTANLLADVLYTLVDPRARQT
jgi:peptide/nickel transport system permease protein